MESWVSQSERPESEQNLLKLWRQFVQDQGNGGEMIRPVVFQAWTRCRELGVDPENPRFIFLTDDELEARKEQRTELVEAALPFLRAISLSLTGKPHVVALGDSEGWVLELFGTPNEFGGRASGIWPGACWSERNIGNNGLGTALALGQPVVLYGAEHYSRFYHGATCLGVPIRVNGRIIGAIDVSVTSRDARPETEILAQACVSAIEANLEAAPSLECTVSDVRRLSTMETLLATALHDVKNQLTAIRAISQLGAMTSSNRRESERFSRIMALADSYSDVIKEQLSSSVEKPVHASVAAIVEDAVREYEAQFQLGRIHLEYRAEAPAEAWVKVSRLRRAMGNLIDNAIRATPSGESISINVSEHAQAIRIVVADRGSGVPPEVQKNLFRPFVHGRQGGTGLGLYMVHRTITKEHGGRVWYEPSPGGGASFVIEIPRGMEPGN